MGYTSSYASQQAEIAALHDQESIDGAKGVAHFIAFLLFAVFFSWLLGPAVLGVIEGTTFVFVALTLGFYIALVAGVKAGIRHLIEKD